MKKTILQAKDVCKSFATNGRQNHVLDMINLEIYEGDFTVIMGSSGAGKSTLLYALSGMDSITSGQILYKGVPLQERKEKEMAELRANEFGFVFQQTHLIHNLSLLENVTVSGYLNKKKNTKETRNRAMQLLDEMRVGEAKDRMPFQVSGGEAQRAAIARAMINEPSVLFADEPTGSLNKRSSEEVMQLMTQLHKQGQSIVMVTHDSKAALHASRLLYLEDGKIIDEMLLPPYQKEELRKRETQVTAWLTSLEW